MTGDPIHNHHIDWILYRGLSCVCVGLNVSAIAGVYPSDHFPVVAVFAL